MNLVDVCAGGAQVSMSGRYLSAYTRFNFIAAVIKVNVEQVRTIDAAVDPDIKILAVPRIQFIEIKAERNSRLKSRQRKVLVDGRRTDFIAEAA
jgi:hypothetical protein